MNVVQYKVKRRRRVKHCRRLGMFSQQFRASPMDTQLASGRSNAPEAALSLLCSRYVITLESQRLVSNVQCCEETATKSDLSNLQTITSSHTVKHFSSAAP